MEHPQVPDPADDKAPAVVSAIFDNATAATAAGTEEPAPEGVPPVIGIQFYDTAKGDRRCKLGPVEQVPGELGTVSAVITAVLVSDSYESEAQLRAELDVVLGAVAGGDLLVIGSDYVPPALVSPGDLRLTATFGPAAALDLAPEQLQELDGSPVDKRRLGIIAALDRGFQHLADPRARRIWMKLLEGKTISEAVEATNALGAGGKNAPLSYREGFELAQREMYRLLLHVAIVQNRDIRVPG